MALDVTIVSTEHRLWSGEATYVSAPTSEGSVGILPGRQPLLASLGKGKVVVRQDQNVVYSIETNEGFLSVDSDRIIVALDEVGILHDSQHNGIH